MSTSPWHPRRPVRGLLIAGLLASAACGPAVTQNPTLVAAPEKVVAPAEEQKAIADLLDEWHAAAAAANEERYFERMAEDSVFLGTDATERWDKKAFQAYAHPHFFKGKAWSFHAVRRAVVLAPGGKSAWFDEDLATERLGPARGSGAVVKVGDEWKIALYNLTIPIPNERFDAVKKIIAGEEVAPVAPVVKAQSLAETCAKAAPGTVCGVVDFEGSPPQMKVPRQRKDAFVCQDDAVVHDAVVVNQGRLQDVVVRIVSGLKGAAATAKATGGIEIHQRKCNYVPRVSAALVGQTVSFVNDDAVLHNIHGYEPGGATWFNMAQPKGAAPMLKDLDNEGVARLTDDVHPWKTAYVVVSPNRFFTVTPASGVFTLAGFPPGTYEIEAWHSIYGSKRATVTVKADAAATLAFSYTGKEPFAAENRQAADDVKSFP